MLIAAEANHRIANNLTALSGLLRLKARRVTAAADVEALLLDISGRIETVGRLHRLLAAAKGDRLNVGDYLAQVCDAMKSALAGGKTIAIDLELDPAIEEAPELGLPLGMLTAELVTNSVKYAHPTGVALRLTLACQRTAEGDIAFAYTDDGVGFPEGFDPDRDGGFGMQLVRSLVGQMRGACTWRSDELGLGFTLMLPSAGRRRAHHTNGHVNGNGSIHSL